MFTVESEETNCATTRYVALELFKLYWNVTLAIFHKATLMVKIFKYLVRFLTRQLGTTHLKAKE